jgi:hypothetical protein
MALIEDITVHLDSPSWGHELVSDYVDGPADEIERLLAMSDDEILAEARAEGIDTDAVARDMAAQFQVIARLVRERDKARELLGRSWIRNAQMSRELKATRAERDALAAWECATCGARFAQAVNPAYIRDVTRCTRCVEVQTLADLNSRTRAALRRLCDILGDMDAAQMSDELIAAEQAAREVLGG